MVKLTTHYDNLQVAENASLEVIKGAYRYLAQRWHPDKNPKNREVAERNTKIINEAYHVLSDPDRRRQHDNWIREQRTQSESVPPHPPRPEGATFTYTEGTSHVRTRPAAIWNPNAAASWSIVFTPLFGAWLHAKNWAALGEAERARKSLRWAYVSAVFIIASLFLSDRVAAGVGFWLLVIWYFASGRPQAKYVRERLPSHYSKKGWARPIGVALLIFFAFIGIAAVLSLLLDPQTP